MPVPEHWCQRLSHALNTPAPRHAAGRVTALPTSPRRGLPPVIAVAGRRPCQLCIQTEARSEHNDAPAVEGNVCRGTHGRGLRLPTTKAVSVQSISGRIFFFPSTPTRFEMRETWGRGGGGWTLSVSEKGTICAGWRSGRGLDHDTRESHPNCRRCRSPFRDGQLTGRRKGELQPGRGSEDALKPCHAQDLGAWLRGIHGASKQDGVHVTPSLRVISHARAGSCAVSACAAAGVVRGSSCLLYTSPSPRDATLSRMPSSA